MDQILIDARFLLLKAGVEEALSISPLDPGGALLLAEAVNRAAKVIDESFYSLKAKVIEAAASIPTVESGWGDDDCFFLYHESVGEVSFHDPYGQIGCGGVWTHEWSGVPRQHLAFEAMADKGVRRALARLTRV